MVSQMGQKIRLVKCPKCLKILQEDEDVPIYQCGGCSAILQAKKRNFAPYSTPSAGETERNQVNEPQSEPVTNKVCSSSRQDTVLPSSPKEEYEKGKKASMESTEKDLGILDLSNGDATNEIQHQECSLGDSVENEGEDSSRLESDMINTLAEASESGASSECLSVDHVMAPRASNSSGNGEISPDTSPAEEKQSQLGLSTNKTSSAYDGSESSYNEMEDQLLNENEFRCPGNRKEQGASSSSTFSENRRNGINTYNEWHQNRSLQLEGPGGRLGRQGRRYVSEQLRPDMPFYPREPYTHVSPSYPSHDEFDRYSCAHSLQMPPYNEGMNQECVDYMYRDNPRVRGRGQRLRFSEELVSDRRNHAGWYSGQLHNASYSSSPQRPIEQAEYHPRWSHEIVSDVEDFHRLKERQRVAKRHVCPTAGGAPFVSCYSCSENLQLPVDFLIFKRKHHLLRCGTCTTVLRFSLQSRTHLVPAVTYDRNANSSSSSKSESPRDKAPSKPEKLSSSVKDEELPVARGSPLHRLMGYSTLSQVFKVSQRPPV